MVPKEVFDTYEPTIGIECHVQFNTKTKLFSGADNNERGKGPNQAVSPICFGLPGTLPVLNEGAVKLAVRAGLALNAKIGKISSFDRKHYFYPDLPKGYQITQLDRPIVLAGHVDAPLPNGATVKVRIHHAHLEEDAGKSTHPAGSDYTLVDLNRAGTPLLEIVSEADMHSPAEAKAYVQELYLLMKYAGVTHGDLQHGNMRFDVNISVAKKGAKEWGTRTEVKNLNSFRAVERAAEFEFKRQVELLEKGQKVVQETRGWLEATQKTVSQRSKEDAMDYRYFPEPDVPPLELTDDYLADVKKDMPKLPAELRAEIEARGIDTKTAETLILQGSLRKLDYAGAVLKVGELAGNKEAKFVANIIVHRFIAFYEMWLKTQDDDKGRVTKMPHLPSPQQFLDIFNMFQNDEISSNNVDRLLELSLKVSFGTPNFNIRKLAADEGLLQENDTTALEGIVAEVLANSANQKAADDVRSGEMKAIGFLVGQVMKASKGKANPASASQLIRKQLGV